MWLGMPKPMIPYPFLWEGAVRTVKSHLGHVSDCSEVPDTPLPPGNGPSQKSPSEPPPPQGASGQQLVGGGSWRPEPKPPPPPSLKRHPWHTTVASF